MDKEKLEKAAKHEAYENYDRSYNERRDGFIKGAEWLQSQPIADRLTEEEREKIRKSYNAVQKNIYDGTIEGAIKCTVSVVIMKCLTDIFGKEMFEQ